MKLLCTVFKIWMYWKLCHKTPIWGWHYTTLNVSRHTLGFDPRFVTACGCRCDYHLWRLVWFHDNPSRDCGSNIAFAISKRAVHFLVFWCRATTVVQHDGANANRSVSFVSRPLLGICSQIFYRVFACVVIYTTKRRTCFVLISEAIHSLGII